ncbi:uncharacterized protein LAESUDRAFT_665193, partial [Laetiporus sulphureus 93-53]
IVRDSVKLWCFMLEFHFKENLYFFNKVLKKEYRYMPHPVEDDNQPDSNGITQSMLEFSWEHDVGPKAQKIDWKDDLNNLTKLHPQVMDDDDDDMLFKGGSFFNFFENEDDLYHIGMLITNIIFPEVINYFLSQAGSHNMVEDDDHEDNIYLEE